TDMMVISNDRLVNRSTPVSIQVNNVSLAQTLEALLNPMSLTYKITENTVVITEQASDRRTRSTRPVATPLQQRVIRGRVTDGEGEPLQGVTVSLQGTTAATTTDDGGQYQITLPENGTLMVFSLVGYEPVEHAIADVENTVNI